MISSKKSRQTLLDGYWTHKTHTLSLKTLMRYLAKSKECPVDLLPAVHGFLWLYDLEKTHLPEARKLARDLITIWKKNHQTLFFTKNKDTVWRNDLTGARLNTLWQLRSFLTSTATNQFCKQYTMLKARHIKKLKKSSAQCLRSVSGLLWEDAKMLPLFIELVNKQKIDSSYRFFSLFRDLAQHCSHYKTDLLPLVYKLAPILRFFRHGNGQLAYLGNDSLWEKAFEPFEISSEEIDMLLSPYQTSAPPLFETERFLKCLGFGASLFVEKAPQMNFEWQSQDLIVKGKTLLCDEHDFFQFRNDHHIVCEQYSKTEVELALTDPVLLQAFSLKPDGIEGCIEAPHSLKTILCFESESIVLDSAQKIKIGPFVFWANQNFECVDKKIFLPCRSSVFWEIFCD